jgi:3-deoxy-D-manno-octulosonic-acid transferase
LSAWIRVLFGIYAMAMELVVWLVLAPALLLRASTRTRAELHMRLGRASPSVSRATPTVLVHAVSLGEVNAAAPLIDELAARSLRVVLTTGTPAGLDAAEKLRASRPYVDAVTYLPWDRRAIRGWLSQLAPSAVVIVETEIWPQLFRAANTLGIPLILVNARLRDADVRRYQLLRGFFSYVLGCAASIGARSGVDRDRYIAIGADPEKTLVLGCLKTDAAVVLASRSTTPIALPPATIVAASTHQPEEALLLAAMHELEGTKDSVRLVLVPRRIERAPEVLTLARRHGVRAALWSRSPPADWDVLVVDTYGDLPRFYAGATLVVLGGTFTTVGGHNLLEAAVWGRPVIVGPSVEQIADSVDEFERSQAVLRVPEVTPTALADVCRRLLDDSDLAEGVGRRAAAVCVAGPRAAPRYADLVCASLVRPVQHDC